MSHARASLQRFVLTGKYCEKYNVSGRDLAFGKKLTSPIKTIIFGVCTKTRMLKSHHYLLLHFLPETNCFGCASRIGTWSIVE